MAAAIGAIGQIAGMGMQMAMPFIEQNWAQSASSRQRGWEEMMFDTRYQRTVSDMKAAGLNPALMFGSANVGGVPGASAPSYQGGAPNLDIVGGALKGIAASKQLQKMGAEVDTAKAVRDKAQADAQVAGNNAKQSNKLQELWPTLNYDRNFLDWSNDQRRQRLLDIERESSNAALYRMNMENRIRRWDVLREEILGRQDISENQKAMQFHNYMEYFNPFANTAKGAMSYETKTGGLFREKGE